MTAADLDREDRLADRQRVVGQGQEPFWPLEALDEQDDRLGRRIVEAVGEVVAQVEHDLRAAAHDARPADPGARVDERVRNAPGLGDPGHATAPQPGRHVADVGRAPGREIDHAHAVRAQDGRAGRDADLADLGLHPGGRFAALHDAATGDDDGPHARLGRVSGEPGGPERVHREDDGVRHLRQRREVRVAAGPVDLFVLRIDEVARLRPADIGDVVADGGRDTGSQRRPDDGDRARCEQTLQVETDAADRRRHPTTRSTPRRSRARAMTSRWISLVPSQIRSTRSSRRYRSAGNSRM